MLTRQTLGIPGLLGALLLVAWVVGFFVLGIHGPLFHVLVPVAAFLILMQGVRRVDHDD